MPMSVGSSRGNNIGGTIAGFSPVLPRSVEEIRVEGEAPRAALGPCTGAALGAAHEWFDSPVVEALPSPAVELGQWRDAARGLRWLAFGATAAWIAGLVGTALMRAADGPVAASWVGGVVGVVVALLVGAGLRLWRRAPSADVRAGRLAVALVALLLLASLAQLALLGHTTGVADGLRRGVGAMPDLERAAWGVTIATLLASVAAVALPFVVLSAIANGTGHLRRDDLVGHAERALRLAAMAGFVVVLMTASERLPLRPTPLVPVLFGLVASAIGGAAGFLATRLLLALARAIEVDAAARSAFD